MKISLVSDLHLEFGYQELPGGEVLILAGDIAEARSIQRHHHETKLVSDSPNEKYRCSEFFAHECKKYDRVFYVMGNHEHYHGKFRDTYDTLKYMMPDNVTLLEDEALEYNGVLFLGATLWTDLNRRNPITAYHLKDGMNDYHVIMHRSDGPNTSYNKLRPEYTCGVHEKTLQYFQIVLSENRDKPVVVITHHAPSFESVDDKYRHDYHMNGGYASDLSEWVLNNENIKYWVHGHMHNPVDYMIGNTRVLSNPRGYVGYEDNNGFDPNFNFEI
jgi:Icc-related predicted phosphoesterase